MPGPRALQAPQPQPPSSVAHGVVWELVEAAGSGVHSVSQKATSSGSVPQMPSCTVRRAEGKRMRRQVFQISLLTNSVTMASPGLLFQVVLCVCARVVA